MNDTQQFSLAVSQWLSWLIQNHPGEMWPIPFTLGDAARGNDKRPAFVKLFVPDSWAMNIKGEKPLLDTYVAIRIPGHLMAEWKRVSGQAKQKESEERTENVEVAGGSDSGGESGQGSV